MSEKIFQTIVPAVAGWYVAVFIEGDIYLDPIIAWEVERVEKPYHPGVGRLGEQCISHWVDPLTINGNMTDFADTWAIKRPDGKFEIPHDRVCDNEAEVIKEFERREKCAMKRRK